MLGCLLADTGSVCSGSTRCWVLYTYLAGILAAGNAPSSSECSRLLMGALAWLALVREEEFHARDGRAAWPATATVALQRALVACWRQAVLQPLRAVPIDWVRFMALMPGIPSEAVKVLQPELEQVTRPGGRLCGCSSREVAMLSLVSDLN